MLFAESLRRLPAIRIRDAAELYRYVAGTTALCVAGALSMDVVNQLVFFEGWPAALRSWCITIGIVVAIAIPVSRAIGKAHLALYTASRTDPLTGLLNRRALLDGIDDEPIAIALVIVDIDRFKQVNDSHGHLAGDEALCTVARIMAQSVGAFGRVGRLGGEEFALLASRGQAGDLVAELDRFRALVASTPIIAGTAAVSVTISGGLARRDAGQSFAELYARADRALYMAKAAGRNRIVSADELPSLGDRDQPATRDVDRNTGRSAA